MEWLKQFLDYLAPGWVGSIIGLIGIVLAAATYFLTRQRSRFAYRCVGRRFLGLSADGLPQDISVQYKGREIPRLTRSLVVFWNDGERSIGSDDITSTDPLRMHLEDGEILAATVLKQSRSVCQVHVDELPGSSTDVVVSFEFLDSNDGAVVEILHTGEKRHAAFLGTIRGLPLGLTNLGSMAAYRRVRFPLYATPRKMAWPAIVMGFLFLAACAGIPIAKFRELQTTPIYLKVIFGAMGSIYCVTGFAALFIGRRRYPKSLHIDELG